MSKEKNLETLVSLNQQLEATEQRAELSRIDNPSKEVESSLVSFVTSRLNKIQQDAEFTDLIRMHIRQRLPEASFEELTKLLNDTSIANNMATEGMMKLFKNEASGKTVIDNLKEASVESKATQLYNSTEDKNILQSISYLSQIMSKMNSSDAEIVKDK